MKRLSTELHKSLEAKVHLFSDKFNDLSRRSEAQQRLNVLRIRLSLLVASLHTITQEFLLHTQMYVLRAV